MQKTCCLASGLLDGDSLVPALSNVHVCRFSVVRTYCGHGIGDLFHCAPNIPHYGHNKVAKLRA